LLSAGFYAKKLQKPMWVYLGTNMGHMFWRSTDKVKDALNRINNSTGEFVFAVSPTLEVVVHKVER
jgi:hypothetical protein